MVTSDGYGYAEAAAQRSLGGVSAVVRRPLPLKSIPPGKDIPNYAKRVYLSVRKIYSFQGEDILFTRTTVSPPPCGRDGLLS